MRIRLQIERQELPVTRILWNVPPETTTIAKLLEQIHEAVPLESIDWAVDDYYVEVNGYEALHYSAPHYILHEDDEVRIRPLQSPDIRQRVLSGRIQITKDGVHLTDGVVFGKMPSKRFPRPKVYIEPRKRARQVFEEDNPPEDGELDATPTKKPRVGDAPKNANDELDDIHEETQEEVLVDGVGNQPNSADGEANHGSTVSSGKRRKSVSFDESSLSAAQDEDEDEMDDGDYEPDSSGPSDGAEAEEEASDAGTAIHHSIEAEASEDGSATLLKRKRGGNKKNETNSPKRRRSPRLYTDEHPSSSESSSDSDSVSSLSSDLSDPDSSDSEGGPASQQSAKSSGKTAVNGTTRLASEGPAAKQEQPSVAPGQGKSRTHYRNQRRKTLRRHLALQRLGQEQTGLANTDAEPSTQSFDQQRQNLVDSIAAGGVDVTADSARNSLSTIGPHGDTSEDSQSHSDSAAPMSQVKESISYESLPANAVGTSHANVAERSPATADRDSNMISQTQSATPVTNEKSSRSRLDLKGSNRMIFSSLGVRNPRTLADQDRLRNQFAAKSGTKNKKPSATSAGQPAAISDAPTDPNAWETKIKLSAVECVDEGVILSTPPFPFKQRWDPQQQVKGKKRKRGSQQFYDYDDSFYYDEAGDQGLNYDDDADESLVGDSQQEDLPTLPADVASLVEPSKTDLRPQAVIAFKQLEVSAATGWEPRMSPYKSALIEEYDEDRDMLKLQLAKRDCRNAEPQYDEDGNRIYGKYEMAQIEDDNPAASGQLELEYYELVEAKLVQAAPRAISRQAEQGASQANTDAETTIVPETMVEDQSHDSIFTSEGVASNLAEPGTQRDSQASAQSLGGRSSTSAVMEVAASEGATPGHSQGGLVEASA